MHRSARWTLVLVSVAELMVALDILVVSTAMTTIRRSLHASTGQLEWTVNAYNLSYAVLVAGAAVGDRFGRRRAFAAGLALFTAASAACAVAPGAGWLIAGRAAQGAGAALVGPLGLSLVSAAYPDRRRGRALGVVSGVAGLATFAGPLLGGAVAGAVSWQWIFWLNVPIGVLAVLLVLLRGGESFGPDTAVDLPGVALVTLAATGLVFGLVRAADRGWTDPGVLAGLLAGAAVMAAFLAWERRAPHPMLPPALFRDRRFAAGNAVTACHGAVVLGSVFLMAQYLQTGLGYGPLGAGLRLLPWTGSMMLVAPLAGALADRIGPRPVTVAGLLLGAAGFGWLALVAAPGLPYERMVAPLVIAGIGNSAVFPAAQAMVLGTADPAALTRIAGINTMIREFGGMLGIAVSAAIFATAGGYGSARAFTTGFTPAMATCAAFGVLGTIAAVLPAGRMSRTATPAPTTG